MKKIFYFILGISFFCCIGPKKENPQIIKFCLSNNTDFLNSFTVLEAEGKMDFFLQEKLNANRIYAGHLIRKNKSKEVLWSFYIISSYFHFKRGHLAESKNYFQLAQKLKVKYKHPIIQPMWIVHYFLSKKINI